MSIIKLNNRSVKDITQFGSISSLGSLTHIATQTASSSASLSFTSGIDSTYKEYIFYFSNIHMATDSDDFGWQANTASETGYNETVTSTAFTPYHQEDGGSGVINYNVGSDQAQGTGIIQVTQNQGNGADDNAGGFLHLFNPSQTNHVKHFISSCSYNHATVTSASLNLYVGGYVNTTAAIDDIKFYTRSGGNIDSGQILLFGLN
tara:strand:- start:3455 stop:4069 length:615 start_codon:yes stop_codon:yes gene_type:complete